MQLGCTSVVYTASPRNVASQRELLHLHSTRNDTFLHGSEDALAFHTERTALLEGEYLRRNPDRVPYVRRTRHGSREMAGQDA